MYERFLKKAGCDPGVIAHCLTVAGATRAYARSSVVDRPLLEAGAMLHDLGRSETHALDHAGVGADLAAAMGCPDGVVRIVGRHLGAGLTLEESALLGLLPVDAMPERLEERIVAHADNLVKGTREITAEERWDRSVALGRKYLVRAFRLGLDLEPLRHLR
ncbi:metal dependent phosphohydrolase [Methanofollis liminatans DSM 4140]|uniref:Metal dependent phosphohydrolase n=1 Tax=Methanofollis liminatans DSM 4140 TaxID=28892 RepID=J1L383_9EURY|nr:HDIG domain-containing metalloprotein [Methanofollis liminatans]EJG07542.1 metal dependent phosphohydrolase [Methanofollis liminatans DSM 4140]